MTTPEKITDAMLEAVKDRIDEAAKPPDVGQYVNPLLVEQIHSVIYIQHKEQVDSFRCLLKMYGMLGGNDAS